MAELVQEIDATSFAYLHIPADTGKPIVERRARMNTCLEDDVLREEMCASRDRTAVFFLDVRPPSFLN